MATFVTDRSVTHLSLLKKLEKIWWYRMTDAEKAQWYAEAAKGAYNYTDLNRVEAAVEEIAGFLGLTLTTKTDWTAYDTPTQAEMERYLSNVVAIQNASPGLAKTIRLPDSMAYLTLEGANNIEKVLSYAYASVGARLGEAVLGSMYLAKESD